MTRPALVALVPLLAVSLLLAAEEPALETMDQMRFRPPKDKGRAELVEGKVGKAVRFSFDKDCRTTFFTSNLRGSPEWDKAAGLSFWVKGDGSDHFGGLQLIYENDFALRYDFMFPIQSTEWTKVTVTWRDLIPVLPGPKARLLDPAGDNRPSKVSALWFGKWWYWRDYAAHSFAIDEIRLERQIPLDTKSKPAGPPLGRVLAKLNAGQPITVVTMGDSLTDFNHWANKEVSWPALLRARLKEKHRSEATLVNPAIGGTQLRQNLVLVPRWLARTPEPDLVTLCFGFNDWDAGMRGEQFEDAYRDAVDRVRRATGGKADVLILTTVPSVGRWTTMAELADACRKAARERNAGLADAEKAFHAEGKDDREKLFAKDKIHLSAAGHALLARTVLQAIESSGQ